MTTSSATKDAPAAITPTPPWRPGRHTVAVLAVAYWIYVVNGVVNSEVGPSLLGMVQSFRVDLATAGSIFTAQFVGYLLGALGSGVVADRWGYQRVMVLAAVLTAGGTAGTAFVGTWPAAIALTVAAGAGFGITDSLCNAVVAAQVPGGGGGALNLLHTFFGVGALLGPLLVGLFLTTPAGWHTMFLVTGGLALSCVVFIVAARIPPPLHLTAPGGPDETSHNATTVVDPAGGRTRGGRRLWLLVGLLCLFVGVEQLTCGWSTTYLNRALGAHLDVAARSVALYWAAVTVGRLLASALAMRLSNERLLGGSAVVALVALVALASAPTVGVALVGLTAVGLSFAPIYPTIMAIAARAYPRRFATLAGLITAAGGLGGAIVPWLGGIVGQSWGLHATIWLGVGIALLLLTLFVIFLSWGEPGEDAV